MVLALLLRAQRRALPFSSARLRGLVVGTRATGTVPLAVARMRAGEAAAARTCTTRRCATIPSASPSIASGGRGGHRKSYVTVGRVQSPLHHCAFRERGAGGLSGNADVLARFAHLAGRGGLEIEFLGQTSTPTATPGDTLADLLLAAADIPHRAPSLHDLSTPPR